MPAQVPVIAEQVLQDLRYAARSLRRTPGFALVAILCLAVGISVNTAAFSVLNAFVFRDFPGVERKDDIAGVAIGIESERGRRVAEFASVVEWEMLREGVSAFSGVAAFRNLPLSVRAEGEPQAVRGALVSNDYFEVLGTRAAAGRFMTPGDDPAELDHVAVISHRYWERTFGARADIAGQVLTVGTRAFTIVGVAPEGFFGLYPGAVVDPDVGAPDVFIPLAAAPFIRPQAAPVAPLDDNFVKLFGRLKDGASFDEALAQANLVAARLRDAYPAARPNAFAEIHPGGDRPEDAMVIVGVLLSAMAVPALVLLVACANLANQLLARAIQRSREIAVRLSLGATRARIVRQLLVETALLAVIASGIGVVLARWMLGALRALVPVIPFGIPIDARVLAFTIGLALLTALAFGLVPALRATRTDLAGAIKDGGQAGGYRRSRLRSGLVIAQIAASLAMMGVSTVFVRAAQRPASMALEELEQHALLVSVNLDLLGFDAAAGGAYQRQALERLGALPGVAAAGMAPFSMFDMLQGTRVAGVNTDPDYPDYEDLAAVSAGWFAATNTHPVRGRLFTAADEAGPPAVVVVDEQFAREFWGTGDALGQTLRIGEDSAAASVTVIGVIPTRQEVSFRQPEGVMLIPASGYNPRMIFYVRTAGPAAPMMATVREALRALDARVPVLWVRTLEDVAAREVAPFTTVASGLAGLGTVSLALAALGLFGVLSFIVAQRRYEIGVRVALGAQRGDVTWMVVRQALGLGAGGVAAGAVIAFTTVAAMRAVMHGLEQLDLPAFAAMSAMMVAVALLASAMPARRAASVDPMQALRAE